jgi:hypothetical protein
MATRQFQTNQAKRLKGVEAKKAAVLKCKGIVF